MCAARSGSTSRVRSISLCAATGEGSREYRLRVHIPHVLLCFFCSSGSSMASCIATLAAVPTFWEFTADEKAKCSTLGARFGEPAAHSRSP